MTLIIEIKQAGSAGCEVTMASPPEQTITQQELDAYKAIKAGVIETVKNLSGSKSIIVPGAGGRN